MSLPVPVRFPLLTLALCLLLLITANVQISAAQEQAAAELLTVAETSDFQATSTYAEVRQLCRQLAQSPRVVFSSLGTSFEGRALPLLVISADGVAAPQDVSRDKKLVVFAMGNIHAGEVCGKEALLMVARQLAWPDDKQRNSVESVLDKLVVLLAPIYNADGNERFSTEHRQNQVGPARGMGQRRNAQDLDLNRDNMKLESPESRALAQLITDWQPAVCIDTHTTNGSYHQYTITYDGPRHPATPGELVGFTRDEFLPAVGQRLARSGYKSFFYGNFDRGHDRWETYPDWPRFCTHYFGLRGTVGVLSEAYAYASYRDRVLATRDFVRGCLEQAADEAARIRQLVAEARQRDQQATEFAIQSISVPLGKFDVLGFEEPEGKDGKSNGRGPPRTFALEYLGLSRPTKTVTRPWAYAVPASYTNVKTVLAAHGIQLARLPAATEAECELIRLTDVRLAEDTFQGHRLVHVQKTELESRSEQLPAGTIIVRTDQPMLGGLIVNLLEPVATDSLCSWNFFDDAVLKNGRPAQRVVFPVRRIPKALDAALVGVGL